MSHWGVQKRNMFGDLPTFLGPSFHGLDEMHLFTNVAKLIFDMLSPLQNSNFKFKGNEAEYPFLFNHSKYGPLIKLSTDISRKTIPPDFHGSFNGVDLSKKTRGQYRSVDWLDWLRYILPTLVTPRLYDKEAAEALNSLAYAITIAMQWNITESQVKMIEK